MRRIGHWTPTYIYDRVKLLIWEMRHPDYPWLTPAACFIIQSYLKTTDVGLEFGAGRSTAWLAQHMRYLTSIENDAGWYDRVADMLARKAIKNVDLVFLEKNEFLKVLERFKRSCLDFVLVDSPERAERALAVVPYVRPGGMLVIDNINLFLPSNSRSPNSRTYDQGPSSTEWRRWGELTRDWRCIWTTNGISDTAVYFRPCG